MENGRILQGRAEGRRGIPRGQWDADGRESMMRNGWGETYYQGRIEPSQPPPQTIFSRNLNSRGSRSCARRVAEMELRRADASKSQWRRAEASGWSTRLACCLRLLAADTRRACVCERHADLKTHRFGNPVCFLRRHAVFPASRRKQHASRVLHPGVAVARQRNLDAFALICISR